MTARVLSIRQPEAVTEAVAALRAGMPVVIPTDTVYGVAVLPQGVPALLERVYGAREADPWPALPLLIAFPALMDRLARPTRDALRLAQHFWPGGVTLVLPVAPDFPLPLDYTRVGLRVPDFPPLFPLLRAVGEYLIVGRAARTGYPSSITAQEAAQQLGDEIPLILDGGPSTLGLTSTVVDCIEFPPRIVQHGAIPDEQILTFLEEGEGRR